MAFITGIGESVKQALRTLVEASVDTGVADDSSAVNHLDDSSKSWPIDAFVNLIIEITGGTGEGQIRKIASNTATSIVPVTNFDTAPDSTSTYRIGFFGKMTGEIGSHAATPVVLHSSGAETANGNSADIDVGSYIMAEYCLDITNVAGAPAGIHILLEGKDQTSGKYKTIDERIITATGTYWLTITTLSFKYVRCSWNTFDGVDDSVTFSAALECKA